MLRYSTEMRTTAIIVRALLAILLVGACLSAALAVSVSRHFALVAYGLRASDAIVLLMIAGFGMAALLWLGLALLCRKSARFRVWPIAIAIPFCLALSVFAVFSVYNLEVKYDKGESSLRRSSAFCRDLPTWQSRAAALNTGILRAAQLDPLPERTPLNAVIHSRREYQGYTVENVFMETTPGFYLAGSLYRPLPDDSDVKRPIVVIPQGHFPNGRFNEDMQQIVATFARMGALAFTYDMVGRGESTQVNHENPNALTLQLWNSMRVLDFLLGLPNVDSRRLGMTDASGGGTQTFLCTAVDDRVTVSAPVVMVSSWMYGGCECESGLPIQNTSEFETNNAEIAAMAAPRPLLVVSIDEDWTRTVPKREFPYIRGVYQLFCKEDLVRNVHLPREHHDFGPSKRDSVYRFFAEHLNLSLAPVTTADGRIDETPNITEPQEIMRAFDSTHRLPSTALGSWDSIMKSLSTGQSKDSAEVVNTFLDSLVFNQATAQEDWNSGGADKVADGRQARRSVSTCRSWDQGESFV
jgi:hypothetical protein